MTLSNRPRNIPPAEGSRGTPQSRFIPREELNAFAAWAPGDIVGGPPPQNSVQRGQPEESRVDVAEQIAAQVRAARQSGYQDGYRDGLVALEGFKQSFASQTTSQIGAVLKSLGEELAAMQQDMARTLAVAATHLARQIVRNELTTKPELVSGVAQEAIDTMLLSARHITLRVNPDDHGIVAQGAADVLAARGARLLSDASISRGGCLVESDIGVIDAQIETRWLRAAASLGCDEPWDGNVDLADDEDASA